MILIVDNYDSFVFNVARYFEELGERVRVVRNDEVTPSDLKAKAIVISPGPCTPKEAGQSLEIVERLSGEIPILGICLGHQVIGEAFGHEVTRATRPMHGDSSEISHDGSGLFEGLPQGFSAGRYHSLIVRPLEASRLLETAKSDEGEIMGLRHRTHPTFGVQFHPESILTEHGYDMLPALARRRGPLFVLRALRPARPGPCAGRRDLRDGVRHEPRGAVAAAASRQADVVGGNARDCLRAKPH
jgi:para-aminobenzoate synthetase component II